MKHIVLLVVLAVGASAQTFTKIYEKTLSAASGASTIQQPASPSKTAHLIGISLYSSVNTTFTLEAAGAASGSATTASATSPGVTAISTIQHYADSNASQPLTPINKYIVQAGTTVSVPFTNFSDASNAVLSRKEGQNFTVRSSSITGNIQVTWLWREE